MKKAITYLKQIDKLTRELYENYTQKEINEAIRQNHLYMHCSLDFYCPEDEDEEEGE